MYQPSSLLTRRQQQNCYLQQLELPPLSHLLPTSPPTSVAPKPACTAAPLVAVTSISTATATTNTTTTATAPSNSVYYYPPLLVPEQNQGLVAAPSAATNALSLPLQYDPELHHPPRTRQLSESSDKIYSFVSIPGTTQKKRPRRRYDEIERLYQCNWPGCTKAYGTLNHLNAHVSMQKHGSKRHPSEFKEMRKEWRRQKKEREASAKKVKEEAMLQFQLEQQQEHAATAAALSALSTTTVFPTIPYQDPLNGFY